MGFKCEINYILRLRRNQGLSDEDVREGQVIHFTKEGHRIYPVDAPIDLANESWEAVARVAIRTFCVGAGRTTGTAEVLAVYDEVTRVAITRAIANGERINTARTNAPGD